jgi:hypothetical protein
MDVGFAIMKKMLLMGQTGPGMPLELSIASLAHPIVIFYLFFF